MREILFRGKRVGCNKWVEGYYVKPTRHWHEHGIHDDWIINSAFQNGGVFNVMGRYAVIKETVGQYTGLTDKNGKKIFEGDIVDVVTGIQGYKSTYHIATQKVRYESGSGMAVFLPFDNSDMVEVEVIGNIYDNPELLGE